MSTQKKSNGNSKTVAFVLSKETKGALRYQEVNGQGQPVVSDADGALVGTIYLRKHAMAGATPQTLRMTLEF